MVTAARAPASRSRTAIASAPKPVNSGSAIAPSCAHAYRVATYAAVIGRNTRDRVAGADAVAAQLGGDLTGEMASGRPSCAMVSRPVSSTPMTAGSPGCSVAQRRRQLSVSANMPPVNQVAHSGPRLVSRTAV